VLDLGLVFFSTKSRYWQGRKSANWPILYWVWRP